MKILGIDPALKITGYGFIESEQGHIRLMETGIIQPKSNAGMAERILKIYSTLHDLVKQYEPDVFVLEKLYAHYRHPTTASILGHVRGVVCLLCAQQKISLAEHSAKRIRKALTGNGNASKQQTLRVVAQRLKIDEKKLTLDASDALALALGYCDLYKQNTLFHQIYPFRAPE